MSTLLPVLQALRFVGILSSRCCDYMPLLILSPEAVLSDLPVTLPSLLSNSKWSFVAEKLVEMLWESTKRICNWVARLQAGDEPAGQDGIDRSENSRSLLLAHAMREACLSLKHYLPLEKRLRLANLAFP